MKIEEVLEEQRIRDRIRESIKEESLADENLDENFFLGIAKELAVAVNTGAFPGTGDLSTAIGIMVGGGVALGAFFTYVGSQISRVERSDESVRELMKNNPQFSRMKKSINDIEQQARNPDRINNPNKFISDIHQVKTQLEALVKKTSTTPLVDRVSVNSLKKIQSDLDKKLRKAIKRVEKEMARQ